MLVAITTVSELFYIHLELLNIALIHLIPIIVVAIHGNIKLTFVMTFIILVLFNFLYVPPLYSLSVHNTTYVWSFIIFALVGYIIAVQANKIYVKTKENEMREVLLNIISHDLKTPLSSIHCSINLLLENEQLSQDTKSSLLHEIQDSSNRMKRLITSFLDNARLNSEDNRLKYDWCDFEDIVGVALQDFNYTQCRELLVIDVQDLQLYWGDNALLVRLVANLLDNAFKYSIKDKKIKLAIYEKDSNVHITIFNESNHIDQKKLDNIFDKFYRIEDTNDISGSGIGLSICKSIVTAHKGSINAKNVEQGILIEVILPIYKRVQII